MKSAIRLLLIALIVLLAPVSHADEKRFIVPLEDSPSYGPADAPFTIIEFLDFQ